MPASKSIRERDEVRKARDQEEGEAAAAPAELDLAGLVDQPERESAVP